MVSFAARYKYEKLGALQTDPSLAKLHKRPDWIALFELAPTSKKTSAAERRLRRCRSRRVHQR